MKTNAKRILNSLRSNEILLLKGIAKNPRKTNLWHDVHTLKYEGSVSEWQAKYGENPIIHLQELKLVYARLAGTGNSSIGVYFISKLGQKILSMLSGQA